jgi:Uma2 family endonuclease
MEAARRKATYEDLLAVPDDKVAEIVDGELITSPRPGPSHAIAGSALSGSLVPPFQFGDGGPGGWWILYEPELHLGEDVLVPDLAGWRKERMPSAPKQAYFTLSPDWVCEILSPTTARLDRIRKLPLYGAAQVRHAWLVDPIARTLEVFRLEEGRWVLLGAHGDVARVRVEPFDVVELDLSRWWAGQE